MEHGLGYLPFTEKQVITPTGVFESKGSKKKYNEIFILWKQIYIYIYVCMYVCMYIIQVMWVCTLPGSSWACHWKNCNPYYLIGTWYCHIKLCCKSLTVCCPIPGSVYTGVDFCKKLCGVSVIRRCTYNLVLFTFNHRLNSVSILNFFLFVF